MSVDLYTLTQAPALAEMLLSSDDYLKLLEARRRALLMELAGIENILIAKGRLARRSVQPKAARRNEREAITP